MMKKMSVLVISFFLLAYLQIDVFASSANSSVYVNNQQVPKDGIAVASGNVTYIGADELAKGLGGVFSFRADTMAGTISAGGQELVCYLDGNVATFNGKHIPIPAPMKILNNRLMVPAAFAADKLGAACYKDSFRNALLIFKPADDRLVYSVLPGDTLWKISQTFSATITGLRENNGLSGDMIYIGQKLTIRRLNAYNPSIPAYTASSATVFSGPGLNQPARGYLPAGAAFTISGKAGDWYKTESGYGAGYLYRTVVGISQNQAPPSKSLFFEKEIPVDTSRDTLTYKDYTVVKGDSVWAISQKFGIQDYELASANNISTTTILYPGQIIKIPVHNIALPAEADARYGEVLDWFKQAQYLFPQGKTGRVMDPASGKSFLVKRTMGSGHADTETLTDADTRIMKQLFGGVWNWSRKAFLLEVDGRRFAVSISGMPHAGVDGVQLYADVSGRSGDYGYGPNYDAIAGNGMDGHFDLYFLNGRRHFDNRIDPEHQYTVLSMGGLR